MASTTVLPTSPIPSLPRSTTSIPTSSPFEPHLNPHSTQLTSTTMANAPTSVLESTKAPPLQPHKETSQRTRSWSSLLRSKPPLAGSETLSFVEPCFKDGVLQISEDIFAQGEKIWEDTVVGMFLDKKLPYMVVKAQVEKRWKLEGEFDIALDGNRYYFTFNNEEDRRYVLDEGSFHMFGKLFVIRSWSRSFEVDTRMNCSIPLWVKLRNVPKHLWHPTGLEAIASVVGKPLCLDKNTESRKLLSFARVCVEIDATKELPMKQPIKLQTNTVDIDFEYDWKPFICVHCKCFGHVSLTCAKNPNRVIPAPIIARRQPDKLNWHGKSTDKFTEKVVLGKQAATSAPVVNLSNSFQVIAEFDEERDSEEKGKGEVEQGDVVVVTTTTTDVEIQGTSNVETTVQTTTPQDERELGGEEKNERQVNEEHVVESTHEENDIWTTVESKKSKKKKTSIELAQRDIVLNEFESENENSLGLQEHRDGDDTIHFQLSEIKDILVTIVYGVKFGRYSSTFITDTLPSDIDWRGRYLDDPDRGTVLELSGDKRKEAAVVFYQVGLASIEHIKIHRPKKNLKQKYHLAPWGAATVEG